MTYVEALKAMIYLANNMPIELHNRRLLEAISKSIEALQKQIPKKPTPDDTALNIYTCPSCRAFFNGYRKPHHCICGQAIDWSDTE